MPPKADLILRGGNLVLPAGPTTADVAMRNGVIVSIGRAEDMPDSDRVVDVTGADVLPGGIDVHAHFNTFTAHLDTLEQLSRSAAYGGVTSILGFLNLPPEADVGTGIDHFVEEGRRESRIDFGFHLILRPVHSPEAVVTSAAGRGITSFKAFMAYRQQGLMLDDGQLFDVMRQVAAVEGLLMVHAENGPLIEALERLSRRAERRAPQDYPATRPILAEAEAIQRLAILSELSSCPVYVVHVSSSEGMEAIRTAKQRRIQISAETCPQYLLLDASEMERHGPLAKIAPPLRSSEDRSALWQGTASGVLDVVSSDHGAYSVGMKSVGWQDVFQAPFGSPGTETLVPLLYSEGVVKQRLPLTWLSRVVSEHPARLFGLYPRKGTIAIGADADFVVLNPSSRRVINAQQLHTASDFTLFEGFELLGDVVFSILRGKLILDHGQLLSEPGEGKYLNRMPMNRGGDSHLSK